MGCLVEWLSEQLPDHWSRRSQPCTPPTAQDLYSVGWMVSHEVKMVRGGEPGRYSSSFPTIETRVKISGYIGINLRVKSRKEPPVHGEYLVDVSWGWNIADIADVKAGVVASQAAELFQDRVAGLKVVIDTDCPSWVVSGEERQVLFNTLGMK